MLIAYDSGWINDTLFAEFAQYYGARLILYRNIQRCVLFIKTYMDVAGYFLGPQYDIIRQIDLKNTVLWVGHQVSIRLLFEL